MLTATNKIIILQHENYLKYILQIELYILLYISQKMCKGGTF